MVLVKILMIVILRINAIFFKFTDECFFRDISVKCCLVDLSLESFECLDKKLSFKCLFFSLKI